MDDDELELELEYQDDGDELEEYDEDEAYDGAEFAQPSEPEHKSQGKSAGRSNVDSTDKVR